MMKIQLLLLGGYVQLTNGQPYNNWIRACTSGLYSYVVRNSLYKTIINKHNKEDNMNTVYSNYVIFCLL